MAPSAAHAKGFSSTRLYIGNLSASVDEYALVQLCSKHGKIHKLDYLFHKAGPLKGKPRGYAFVEFSSKDEALRAMVALDDKLVRGRKISVTAASEQQNYDDQPGSSSSAGRGRGASRTGDAGRPTAISLLKGQGVTGVSTNRKIAALEAKLAALRKDKPGVTASSNEGTPEPLAQAQLVDGEAWLDAIEKEAPPSTSESSAAAAGKKSIAVDAAKAGLPAKPKS